MRKNRKLVLGAVVLTAATSIGVVGWGLLPATKLSYAADNAALPTQSQLSHADALSDAFNTVSESMKPSVVSVSIKKTFRPVRAQRRRSAQQLPQGIPEEFRRFFDEGFGQIPEAPYEQNGLGSGVVVSKDGYILTNNHVVNGADEVMVTLFDDRELRAKIVGTDEKTDLAVLKVDARNLTPATLGNSDQSKVGQWVLAIGSPFGLEQTVTAGIISAKSRVTGIIGADGYEDFLQTDAAINPGNSGGPLVNLRGEVIGVNTAIFSRGGTGNVGVGFAIPSNMASNIMESIIKTGGVVRGFLGAQIQPLNEGLAESFHFNGTRGVLIANVLPGSPAEKSGLREQDIVTELNGRPVATPSQLRNGIAALAPKSKANLVIFRDGKTQNLQVTVGEMEHDAVAAAGAESAAPETHGKLGLSVEALTPAIASELGYKGERKGVVVTQVETGSLADRVALQPGDVILAIGSTQIHDLKDYREAVAHMDLKTGARLQIVREGLKKFVFVRGME